LAGRLEVRISQEEEAEGGGKNVEEIRNMQELVYLKANLSSTHAVIENYDYCLFM